MHTSSACKGCRLGSERACLVLVTLYAARKDSGVPEDATPASTIDVVQPLSCSRVPSDLSAANLYVKATKHQIIKKLSSPCLILKYGNTHFKWCAPLLHCIMWGPCNADFIFNTLSEILLPTRQTLVSNETVLTQVMEINDLLLEED